METVMDKTLKVIQSCNTLEQLAVADKYCELASKGMPLRSFTLYNIMCAKRASIQAALNAERYPTTLE